MKELMIKYNEQWKKKPTNAYMFEKHPGHGYPTIQMDKFHWDLKNISDSIIKEYQKLSSEYSSLALRKFDLQNEFNERRDKLLASIIAEEQKTKVLTEENKVLQSHIDQMRSDCLELEDSRNRIEALSTMLDKWENTTTHPESTLINIRNMKNALNKGMIKNG